MASRKKNAFRLLIAIFAITMATAAQSSNEHFKLADAAFDAHNYVLAVAEYTKGLQIDPNDEAANYNRGLANYHTGNYAAVITDLTKVLQIDPQNVDAFYRRGRAYYLRLPALNDLVQEKATLDAAIADYTRAIQIKADHADAYRSRGQV